MNRSFCTTVSLLALAEALSAGPAGGEAGASSEKSVWQEVHPIISKYKGVFGQPPRYGSTRGNSDGPLLGNGDVGVVIAGAPEDQLFYIGKNDFWDYGKKNPVTVGGVSVRMPALQGAAYHQEQILADAEVRGTFTARELTARTYSWIAAEENLLVTELTHDGSKPVEVQLSNWAGPRGKPGQKKGKVLWVTRSIKGRTATIATAVVGTEPKVAEDGTIHFEMKNNGRVSIITAIFSDLDTDKHRETAISRVAKMNASELKAHKDRHRQWWRRFWSQSFVEIGDPLLEKFYYGSLYIMACCSRAGEVPPGIFGNWVTTDGPIWKGDFHMNYNYESAFWGLFSANHIEQTEPYDQPLLDYLPKGKENARKLLNRPGIYCPVGLGPDGMDTHGLLFLGQKYNAAYGAVNMSMRFYHTYDLDYARKIYPYLIEVANFWEKDLEFANGRYAIVNDCLNETHKRPDDVNPSNCMGVVMLAFQTIIDISKELDVDADRRKKWQHILDHFSDFPTYQYKGKTVFNGAEKGQSANGGELGWPIIEHIWPAGHIGLDSDPKLLEVAHNTITLKPSWKHGNCFPMTYTAAARVGYDPNVILENLCKRCRDNGFPNLSINQRGGAIETASAVPSSINEMLLQSHEKVLRFFSVWPKEKDARFGTLRAVGAFLVSSALKDGRVRHVTILSEKGRDCTVQNPRPGKAVTLSRNNKKAETLNGNRFTFKTAKGERIGLVPNE
jgi:hypothetical protein